MPAVSRAQFRFFKAAESNPSMGVSSKVAHEFTDSFHGHPGSVKALPEVKGKAEGGGVDWIQSLRDYFMGPQGPPHGGISSGGIRAAGGGMINLSGPFKPHVPKKHQVGGMVQDPNRANQAMQLPPEAIAPGPLYSPMTRGGAPQPAGPNIAALMERLMRSNPNYHTPGEGQALPDTEPSEPKEAPASDKNYASGGMSMDTPWYARSAARTLLHEGLVNSAVPGRTDKHNVGVLPGAYVVPADVVSGLGQGNTRAGGNMLDQLMKVGPYGTTPPKLGGGKNNFGGKLAPMKMMKPGLGGAGIGTGTMSQRGFAEGGPPEPIPIRIPDGTPKQSHVPIIIAGGEYVVHPTAVRNLGHGDIDKGHRILDSFVKHARKQHIGQLQKLPGPKK